MLCTAIVTFSPFLLDPSVDGLLIEQPASFSQPTLTSSSASTEEAEMIDLDKDLIQTQVTAPTTAE